MADFRNLLNAIRPPQRTISYHLAAPLGGEAPTPPVPKGQVSIVNATRNFLSSFGEKTASLIKASRDRLLQQQPTEQYKMKGRAIEEVTAQSKSALKTVLENYARGTISAEHLRSQAQDILRRQALAAAVIGVGGVGLLTENVLTAVQRQLTAEFKLLDGFIKDVQGQSVIQRTFSRLAQYAKSVWSFAQTAFRQAQLDESKKDPDGDYLREKRELGATDEHCADCVALADEGCQPLGTLPAIGSGTVCGNHCHCQMKFLYDWQCEEQQDETQADAEAANAEG